MDKEPCVATRTAVVSVEAKPRPPTGGGMTVEVLPDHDSLLVLIVDDDAEAAESLGMLLTIWGHAVLAASDGGEVLALALEHRPDVMLLDVAMPGGGGFSLARAVRQHPCLDGALLVAVTGYADDSHRQLGMRAGFDHYLVKPVAPGFIKALLALEAHRKEVNQARRAVARQE
jgi:CheY-like chemotaxis protein